MINALLLSLTCAATPSLSVTVDGEGYLRFIREGRAVYAKSTRLVVTDGKLSDEDGDLVLPGIGIAPDATKLEVDLEGNVFATIGGSKVREGQFVLALFSASSVLQPKDGILIANDRPHLGSPGDDTFGVIRAVDGLPAKTAVKGASATQTPPTVVIPPTLEAKVVPIAPVPTTTVTNATENNVARQPAKLHSLTIAVQEHALVSKEHILLGDIAKIDGDPTVVDQLSQVDLGDTPPIGVPRKIDRERILIKLTLAGLRSTDFTLNLPGDADVRRKGQTIQQSQFVVSAVQLLIDKGGPNGNWMCTDNYGDFEAPNGKVELRAETISGMQSGEATALVAVYVGGNRFNARTIHLHLKDQIPPLKIGSAVKVIMIAGHAEVEVPGIVKTSGRLGDSIQVQVTIGSPPVSTFHTAIVVGPGVVEVKL
jgi:hypothetical protein